MDTIIFSGCSFTYGEGLWRETGDTHQNSINQKYLIENRWITKVANHFNIVPTSKGHNGGNHIWSMQFVMQEVDATTWNGKYPKLVLFQTTQFSRHEMNIDDQIQKLEEMVIDLESKNIPVRFIHWIWPDITEYEMDFYLKNKKNSNPFKYLQNNKSMGMHMHVEPPEDGNKLSSKIIRDRTIYILDSFNFDKMVNHNDAHKEGTLANKYTLASKFKCGDFHMNQEGHDVLANEIINYIEKNKLL